MQSGHTALMCAAMNGDFYSVCSLVTYGANRETRDHVRDLIFCLSVRQVCVCTRARKHTHSRAPMRLGVSAGRWGADPARRSGTVQRSKFAPLIVTNCATQR